MKSRKWILQISTLTLSILSFAGCQSLPWKNGKSDPPTMTTEQYIQQTASNIQYDTQVAPAVENAVSRTGPSTEYTSSPPIASRSSSGGSRCCH